MFPQSAASESGPPPDDGSVGIGMRDVVVLDPRWSVEFFQSFYLERGRKRLKPNVVILKPPEMKVYFETNSNALKGPEVDHTKRLVAVWGDSVVFGVSRGWVEGLGSFFDGFQFLNGGIEGDGLENILERARENNRKLRIEFNIIFPGWHSMKSSRKLRSLLTRAVEELPGPILCTVPTSLSEEVVSLELSSHFTRAGSTKHASDIQFQMRHGASSIDTQTDYAFWGNLNYSMKNAKKLLHQLKQQNETVRELARKKGVPLVDLYEAFYTNDAARFREEFSDAGHPRPSSYPKIQQYFAEVLRPVLV